MFVSTWKRISASAEFPARSVALITAKCSPSVRVAVKSVLPPTETKGPPSRETANPPIPERTSVADQSRLTFAVVTMPMGVWRAGVPHHGKVADE